MGTTITGQIDQTVFLNYGGYDSPLIITKTGTIAPGAFGANAQNYGVGLFSNIAGGAVLNAGTILGHAGGANYKVVAGVDIQASTALINQGVIIGGQAGAYGYAGDGVFTEGLLNNSGFVVGGNANKYFGTGGAGIFSEGTSVANSGLVVGGNDGQTGSANQNDQQDHGFGGIGILLTTAGGTVSNSGGVVGGNGYTSDGPSQGYRSGVGGTGIDAPYVYNKGLAQGGAGSTAVYGGIAIYATTLDNVGTLKGGVGLDQGGEGVVAGTLVENGGVILGGASTDGSGGNGVELRDGGVVFTGGTIVGGSAGGNDYFGGAGIDINGGAGFVVANGTVAGGYAPDAFYGGPGIFLGGGGTVDLFGSVVSGNGASGVAVFLEGGDAALMVQKGAAIVGDVVASYSYANVLQLGNATTGATGQLDMGDTFFGFGTIDFGQGATWALGGTDRELAEGQTINGVATNDTLVLEGYTATSDNYVSGTGLILDDGSTTETLNITGQFSTNSFFITDVAAGTEITLCYLRGTRLMTPVGEAAVEGLAIGDELVTRFGGIRRIKWIGTQSYAAMFLRNNPDKVPVRIGAGALGGGLPRRDLWLTPGHSMLIGGVLVLAKDLVNGTTITQPAPPELVEYYQVEFETHDCVLAEGAWSESYADSPGQRAQFHNAADFYRLYPDHVPVKQLKLCAPRPEAGPKLAAALATIPAAVAA